MPLSLEDIYGIIKRRKANQGPAATAIRELISRYNGDVVVALPEMSREEKPAVANLLAEGVDGTAHRCADVLPSMFFPAIDRRKDNGVGSIEYANIRHLSVSSWWQQNSMDLMLYKFYRHLSGMGSAPMMIWPSFKHNIPIIELRHPLYTFPNETRDYVDGQPLDCGFQYMQSEDWLRINYPEAAAQVQAAMGPTKQWKGTGKFEITEWTDAEEIVTFVSGYVENNHSFDSLPWDRSNMVHVLLSRIPNRIGRSMAVVPQRITLDRVVGQFNQIFGITDAAAQMAALDVIATAKAIFPDIVLLGANGQAPQLVSNGGAWVDGRIGINELVGGDVKTINTAPPVTTGTMLDRLERAARAEGNVPAQWSGESPSNISTGRMGQFVLGAATSPRIAEYQKIGAKALEAVNRRCIAVAGAYSELRKGSFYVMFGKANGQVDYDAKLHFETDANVVRYPMPGADAGAMGVELGQRVGMGEMSMRTMRRIDPLIEDDRLEGEYVDEEAADRIALDAIKAEVAASRMPISDLAVILLEVRQKGSNWADAILHAQAAAQARQASQAPAGSPDLQPGLSVPGQGVEATAEVPPPAAGSTNFGDLLRTLGTGPQQAVRGASNAAALAQAQGARAGV